MVHPGVSGLLFVPICPHTLSFRPLVLPDSVVLTIRVPETARAAGACTRSLLSSASALFMG